MFRNYLKTSFTYFRKHKSFLLINLLGLSTGLTAFYFAFLYVNFELSYDSYHQHAENIYRLVVDVQTPNGVDFRGTPPPIAPAVKATFSEVASSTRILLDHLVLQNEQGVQSDEKIGFTDGTIFSVFTFPLISGAPMEVLSTPFQVVLSQSCAKKYFGDLDPVGRSLLINGKDRAHVTGVMKDIPNNSHFHMDALVSISTMLKVWRPDLESNWKSRRSNSYLLLRPDVDPTSLNVKITQLLRTKIDQPEYEYSTALEPLKQIYLYGKPRGSSAGSAVTGSITNVYLCSLASILVLFIAGLNYINLSTAFSMQRAKEIGVRKLLGASRSTLATQFLSDVILLSLLAFVCSLVFIALINPVFVQISGKTSGLGMLDHIYHLGFLLIIAVITGVLSGLYPSFFLAALQPVNTLKGRFASGAMGIRLRKALVTSQFLLSFTLIVATTVLYKQLYYMQHQEPGFNKDHMLVIRFQFYDKPKTEILKKQLLEIPGVSKASVASSVPGSANIRMETMIETFQGIDEVSNMDAYFVDYSFLDQFELKVVAGRPFSSLMASDSTEAMIVNETTVKSLGYADLEAIIGKRFSQSGRKGIIIGVVKDFHIESFREQVQPLTFQIGGFETFLTLTLAQNQLPSTVAMIESKWKAIAPLAPFTHFFTDDAFNAQYDGERRFSKLFISLVFMAIIISCLGLFGLAVYDTTQRKKEIAVRKILGSSSFNILTMLMKDFLLLVVIGIFLGAPIGWYIMEQWLQEFAYRVDLNPGTFLFASFILIIIAIATIGYQTIKVAHADPAMSLKTAN